MTATTPRFEEDDDSPAKTPGAFSVSAMVQRKFLEQRKVFIWGEVNTESAQDLVEKFLYLEADDPGKPITFYIDRPGGSITDGMAIYDTINFLQCDVVTYCIGMAASMATCARPSSG